MEHKYWLRAWSTALALTAAAILGAGCGGGSHHSSSGGGDTSGGGDSSGGGTDTGVAVDELAVDGEALIGVADGKYGDPSVEAQIAGVGQIISSDASTGFYHVALKAGLSVAMVEAMLTSPSIVYVEPNWQAHTLAAAPTPAGETFPYSNTLVQGEVASAWSAWGWTPASGSITFTTVSAGTNDTVTVNGVLFTAVNGGTPTTVQFDVSGGDNSAATNLAAAINASTDPLLNGVVRASASTATVTLTAIKGGTGGNAVTLAKGGNAGHVSLVQMAGGGGAFASIKVKLASVVAGDKIRINGTDFTAKDVTGGAALTSEDFDMSLATDALVAANLASRIGLSTDANIQNKIVASANSNIVTLSWKVPGTVGNGVAVARQQGTATLTVSNDGVTYAGSGTLQGGGAPVAATGTATLASVTAGQTILIDGATFTARNGGTLADRDFDMSGNDSAAAASLALAINSSTHANIVGIVTASANGAAVTITAVTPGTVGNSIPVSTVAGTITLSGLSGGDLSGGVGRVYTIAVVDTGVFGTHDDLTGKVLTGYNALDGTSTVTDRDGHGTQAAGIAAATINNSAGISGVAAVGNLASSVEADMGIVRIVPVKVSDSTHVPTHASIAKGISWAVNTRTPAVDVVLVSLGSGAPSWTLQNAIQAAHTKNALVVAAAGNSGSSVMKYPAAYQAAKQKVLSVASVDATDTLSATSSFGTWVNVAAPGEGLVTTDIDHGTVGTATNYYTDGVMTYTGAIGPPNTCNPSVPTATDCKAAKVSGTSFSAAFTAGAAALVWSAYPSLTVDQLRTLLMNSVDPINFPKGKALKTNGGRLNVQAAMANAANAAGGVPDPLAPIALLFDKTAAVQGQTVNGTVILTGPVTATAGQAVTLSFTATPSDAVSLSTTSITIPKGASSGTFKVTAMKPSTDVVVTAAVGTHGSVSYTLAVQAPGISGITLSKTSVTGGTTLQGTVTFNAAPSADVTLVIVTRNAADTAAPAAELAAVPDVSPALASTPVKLLAGKTSVKFDIATNPVTTDFLASNSTPNNILIKAYDASAAGTTVSAKLDVLAPAVSSVTYSPSSTIVWDTPGTTGAITGTVTLTGKVKTGTHVDITLTPSDSGIAVPATITVAADTNSQTFSVQPEAVAVPTSFSVQATIGAPSSTNVGKSASFKVNPALTGFTVSPASVSGNGTVTGTITLAAVAPTGGAAVDVTVDSTSCNSSSAGTSPVHVTSSGSAACTTTVTVPQGQKSVTVSVSVVAASYPVAATVTASFLGVDRPATVTSSAPSISSVAFSNSLVKTVVQSDAVLGKVTLSSAAVASTQVDLTLATATSHVITLAPITTVACANDPADASCAYVAATATASISIASGTSSQTFWIKAGGTSGSDTINAVVNGSGATAKTLKVTVAAPTLTISLTGGTGSGQVVALGAVSGTVTLSSAAAVDTTVTLTTNNAAVTGGSVVISKNTTSKAFTLVIPAAGSEVSGINVTAALPNGEYKIAGDTVKVTTLTLGLSPQPTHGAGTDGTMTLTLGTSLTNATVITLTLGTPSAGTFTLLSGTATISGSGPYAVNITATSTVLVHEFGGGVGDTMSITPSVNGTAAGTAASIVSL